MILCSSRVGDFIPLLVTTYNENVGGTPRSPTPFSYSVKGSQDSLFQDDKYNHDNKDVHGTRFFLRYKNSINRKDLIRVNRQAHQDIRCYRVTTYNDRFISHILNLLSGQNRRLILALLRILLNYLLRLITTLGRNIRVILLRLTCQFQGDIRVLLRLLRFLIMFSNRKLRVILGVLNVDLRINLRLLHFKRPRSSLLHISTSRFLLYRRQYHTRRRCGHGN